MMRFITILLLLISAAANCYAGQLAFRGKDVQDPKSGLTVVAEDTIIAVSSPVDHYALVLPYGDNWDFTFETGNYLKGNSGLVNITLSISGSDEPVTDTLKVIKRRLESDSNPLRLESAQIIDFRDQKILKTVIDAEQIHESFRGVKHINYYALKKWGNTLYTLHISKVVPEKEMKNFVEKEFLQYASVGFFVDFNR